VNIKNIYKKIKLFLESWPGTILVVFFVIFFIAQAFIIPTGSMKNTLLIGDGLFGKKFSYGIAIPRIPWIDLDVLPDFDGDGHIFNGDLPQRGDIVIFKYPHNDKVYYVKRLVATGGDYIMLRNKHLYLHLKEGDKFIEEHYNKNTYVDIDNMLWLKDPYKLKYKGIHYDNATFPEPLVNFGPVKVNDSEYFMMGDNRDHSNDSRFWGSVAYKYIVGKPWFIYFSWENRSYLEMKNSNDTNDVVLLRKKCVPYNINDSRCIQRWNKYQYSIRWDRMFTFIK
jgi:signal peptidase I